MTVVLTYGTFDLFHVGHVNILKRARSFGDRLIVGLSSDEFNRVKGKQCVMCFNQRREIVESIKYVDQVIEENDWSQKIRDILEHKADVFVMGNDWEGKFDDLNAYCRVVYLDRTPDVSTTDLKKKLGYFNQSRIAELSEALQAASEIVNALYGVPGGSGAQASSAVSHVGSR